jgi:thioredoxin reductase
VSTDVDVVVVGGGPAGLSAAMRLRERGVSRVVVVEREKVAGGVPRHCVHPGFGMRDLHRLLSGPHYAETMVRRALARGVSLLSATTVTSCDEGGVNVTSARGTQRIDARAVILATGARERPRPARGVPGDRPAGVFTTGQLQQWTYLEGLPVGARALVVGAEHVSFSAILTLRHAGVATVALVTEHQRHQSVTGAGLVARTWGHAPVHSFTRVVEIIGRRRVEKVVLENLMTGRVWSETVDTVVFSGDWIPDHELARRCGIVMDPGTLGPASDALGRTSNANIYAAGNLLHPVESADVVSLWARDVADTVAAELLHRAEGTRPWVTLGIEKPVSWVWPNRIIVGHAPTRLRLHTESFTSARTLQLVSSGHVVAEQRLRRTTPNRSMNVASSFVDALGEASATIRLR